MNASMECMRRVAGYALGIVLAVAGLGMCLPAAMAADAQPADGQAAPSAPAAPAKDGQEAVPLDAVDMDALVRADLMVGDLNVAVPEQDSLQVIVIGGKVWVVQLAGPKPTAAEQPEAEETSEGSQGTFVFGSVTKPVDKPTKEQAGLAKAAKLGQAAIATLRADALANALAGGTIVASECFTSPADAWSVLPEKDVVVKPVAAEQVTWIIISDESLASMKAEGAVVFAVAKELAKDAEPAKDAETAKDAEDAKDTEATRALEPLKGAKSWWFAEDVWADVKADEGMGTQRKGGEGKPCWPDGTPIWDAEQVWVVDQAAWDEPVWVVDVPATSESWWVEDVPAWTETVFVETGGSWKGADEWTCPGCGGILHSQAEVDQHVSDMVGLFYGYIGPSGDPSFPWICMSCGEMFDIYELASEHIYFHAEQHRAVQTSFKYWAPTGYFDTVEHPAEGHWEGYTTEEVGHWETVHHDEVGHWEQAE